MGCLTIQNSFKRKNKYGFCSHSPNFAKGGIHFHYTKTSFMLMMLYEIVMFNLKTACHESLV